MAIEVRCACGQLVYAEERFAGQHVQCPHCKAAVAVPVAVAAAARPVPPPPPKRLVSVEISRQFYALAGIIFCVIVFSAFKGCQEDRKKNQPRMDEIMRKHRPQSP